MNFYHLERTDAVQRGARINSEYIRWQWRHILSTIVTAAILEGYYIEAV